MLPLWSDLLDKKARTRSGRPLADILAVAVPSIAATAGGVASLGKVWLAGLPALNVLTDAMTSIAALAAALYVVMATEAATDGLVSDRRQYRFGQVERRCAKLLLVPTLVVAAFGIWRTLPSGLLGRDCIDGVVCSAETGGPVANASVAVLDRRRTPVSLPGFPTDSLGYFVAQVGWWSDGSGHAGDQAPRVRQHGGIGWRRRPRIRELPHTRRLRGLNDASLVVRELQRRKEWLVIGSAASTSCSCQRSPVRVRLPSPTVWPRPLRLRTWLRCDRKCLPIRWRRSNARASPIFARTIKARSTSCSRSPRRRQRIMRCSCSSARCTSGSISLARRPMRSPRRWRDRPVSASNYPAICSGSSVARW